MLNKLKYKLDSFFTVYIILNDTVYWIGYHKIDSLFYSIFFYYIIILISLISLFASLYS